MNSPTATPAIAVPIPCRNTSARIVVMDAAGHELAFVDLRAARTGGGWLAGRFVASALHLVPEEATWGNMLDALLFIRTQAPRTRVR